MVEKGNDFDYWEERYRTEPITGMAWYYEPLDPDLQDAIHGTASSGKPFLDLGSGPGTQAMRLAELGFKVVATDISQTALDQAQKKALQNNLKIQFVHDNILQSQLRKWFNFIFDRGCFHVLPPEKRHLYIEQVAELMRPGSKLFLKCYSNLQPGSDGPYRFSEAEIRTLFDHHFAMESIAHSIYHGTVSPQPKALFCVMKRTAD